MTDDTSPTLADSSGRSRCHRRSQRHRPGHVRALRQLRARRWRWWTSTKAPAARSPPPSAACSCGRTSRPPTRWKPCTARWPPLGRHRHLLQQRRDQPARRRLHPRTGLDAWERVQRVDLTSVYLAASTRCRTVGPGQGLDHQHGVVRRGDGRGDEPDQLHRLQGRGAGNVARAGGAVRPPGRAGQRAVPRAREHAPARRSSSPRTRAGGAAPGAHPDGTFRRGDGDRRGGGVLGE